MSKNTRFNSFAELQSQILLSNCIESWCYVDYFDKNMNLHRPLLVEPSKEIKYTILFNIYDIELRFATCTPENFVDVNNSRRLGRIK